LQKVTVRLKGAEKFFSTGAFSSFLFPRAALFWLFLNNERKQASGGKSS
jgi:hypothetical protein